MEFKPCPWDLPSGVFFIPDTRQTEDTEGFEKCHDGRNKNSISKMENNTSYLTTRKIKSFR